ncbi:MAG TPA: DNA polymerase IV [Patescibacteria group bacterium]|nr:DNA polymerase IV [Patescibacteria group bacterium]
MRSVIMHLDMNSYFASVEQQDRPAWRGLPVGVCEHLGGIIIGASVEAKRWGITTGTPVWEAKKLYPKIILTHTSPERYRLYTRRFLAVMADYTQDVEKYSIDEAFLDLTKACNIRDGQGRPVAPLAEAARIALEIKLRFKSEVGDWLRCSVGLASGKTLAKIASDLRKPDGLVVIAEPGDQTGQINPAAEVVSKNQLYDRLKLTDVPGIGRRQERNLNELGIRTLAELRDFPKSRLTARFGPIMGHHLYSLGRLESSWKTEVAGDDVIKSMGHMYTLPRQYRRPEFFLPVLYKLCEMVGRRLRRKKLMGNVVHCYVRDSRYQGLGDSASLGYFLQDGRELFLACSRLLQGALKQAGQWPPSGQYKLIGVTVAGLMPFMAQQSLFGDAEREQRVDEALDAINDKYGEFSIIRAQMMKAGKVFRDSVGFGRMKEL